MLQRKYLAGYRATSLDTARFCCVSVYESPQVAKENPLSPRGAWHGGESLWYSMEKYQARPVNSHFQLIQQDPRNMRLGGFRTAQFALIIMECILTNKIVKPYIEIEIRYLQSKKQMVQRYIPAPSAYKF